MSRNVGPIRSNLTTTLALSPIHTILGKRSTWTVPGDLTHHWNTNTQQVESFQLVITNIATQERYLLDLT